MRKFLVIMLAALLCFTLYACSSSNESKLLTEEQLENAVATVGDGTLKGYVQDIEEVESMQFVKITVEDTSGTEESAAKKGDIVSLPLMPDAELIDSNGAIASDSFTFLSSIGSAILCDITLENGGIVRIAPV